MKVTEERRTSELARGFLIASIAFMVTAVGYALQSLFLPIPPAPVLGQLAAALLLANMITGWHDRARTRRRRP